MNWIILESEEQVNGIAAQSAEVPVVVFKHSARCSISNMAKNRMDRIDNNDNAIYYLLDVLGQRPFSQKIASDYDVHHESPQLLLIVNGECVYEESHNGIVPQDVTDEIEQWKQKLKGA